MKNKILISSLIFGITFFIFYTLCYYLLDKEMFNWSSILETSIVSILSAITWGIIIYLNTKKVKNE